jgi:hypothetical protein
MKERFGFLRLLGKVYLVSAWVGVAVGVIALLASDIVDQKTYVNSYTGELVKQTVSDGIGLLGVVKILVATAIHFLVFMGLSQVVRLLLDLDEVMNHVSQRGGELANRLSELGTVQKTTAEHVRLLGELVYKETQTKP